MSIKNLILGAATLASLALPGMASAQRYDGYGYGGQVRYERGYDNRRDYRDDRHRWDERRQWRELQRRREWEQRHRHDWRGHNDRYNRY